MSRVTVHKPHGVIELIECTASDLMVVDAARVSLGKKSSWEYTDPDRDPDLKRLRVDDKRVLQYLMRNKHGTPFEHNLFIFYVKAPIFVFREWHRHRIGVSINEMSSRYTKLRPEFYLPSDTHVRTQHGKPGAYTFGLVTEDVAAETREILSHIYTEAWAQYQNLLSRGIAKEVARLCLPVATYSEMYWSCNARSLMAFLALRNAPTAQREIRDYAEVMEEMFFEKMPVTAQAFIDNGRIAP